MGGARVFHRVANLRTLLGNDQIANIFLPEVPSAVLTGPGLNHSSVLGTTFHLSRSSPSWKSRPTFMSLASPRHAANLRLLTSLLRTAKTLPPHPAPPPPLAFPPTSQYKRHYTSTTSCSSNAQHSASSSSSVSETEVAHFSSLASSWWDPHGPSRLLHLMNPLRHDFIQSCLFQSPTADAPVGKKYTYLDIGCGGGIFSASAARLPSTESVTAIDPTLSVIAVAKAHQRTDPALAEPKLRYLNCAIEDLTATIFSSSSSSSSTTPESSSQQPTPPLAVDMLTLFEVLEHVPSPSHFLTTALPHLRPGGWLIGSTISRSPLSYLTTKLIAEAPLVGVVPRGTHDWNKYINPDEMANWFAAAAQGEWGPVRTQGVIYLPGLGWKMVDGSEALGNYFFGVQRLA